MQRWAEYDQKNLKVIEFNLFRFNSNKIIDWMDKQYPNSKKSHSLFIYHMIIIT